MGDPRWTVEDEALGPQRPMLVFDEPGFGQVIAVCMARRSGRIVTAPHSLAALVVAVRERDLLRRVLAEYLQHNQIINGHWYTPDENGEPHYDNGPAGPDEIALIESLRGEVGLG